MRKTNKIVSFILSLILAISIIPVTVSAASGGTCGENLTWTFNGTTRILTVSGTGEMLDYITPIDNNESPWGSYRQLIETVNVTNGVTYIGGHAFKALYKVVEVSLPNSLVKIGEEAFLGCKRMKTVEIPDGVEIIGDKAFYECARLTDITVPTSIKKIGVRAFDPRITITYKGTAAEWKELVKNNPDSSLNLYKAVCQDKVLNPTGSCGDNVTWIFDTDTGVMTISGEGEIPVYSADNLPWKNFVDIIKNVVIENGVKSIGEQSFYKCNNLTNITIPNSVEIIGKEIAPHSTKINYEGTSTEWFELMKANKNSNLNLYIVNCQDKMLNRTGFCGENVVWEMNQITKCMTISGYGETKDYYAPYGFDVVWADFIDDIHTVVIEDGVESIGEYMFSYCTNLKNVSIPNSVTKIGAYAFCNCGSLANFTIPEGVTEIGDSAFEGCANLTNISFPESVTGIGEYAFAECNLLSVTIPANVTKIGAGSFQGVERIYVDAGNPNYSSDENGVLFNKDKTILSQYPTGAKAEHYTIPDHVTSIGERAFNGCSNLEHISIPYGIKSIPAGAFRYCTDLECVDIPDSVNEIGGNAFFNCKNLKNVNIPNSVTTIGQRAFDGCENLKNVNIPNSVTTIGVYAFGHCTRLKKIIIPDSVSEIGADAFEYSGLEDVVLGKGVTKIWGGTFSHCENLREIVIPENITIIVGSAFHWSSLEKIWIPTSVTEIGLDALGDDLKEVYYMGTKSQWQKVKKYYRDFEDVEIHYSCRKEETPSTCTEQGSVTYFCDCCGAEKLYRHTDLLEHNYIGEETPATCTKHGITDYTCQDCGASYFDYTANPTGHKINADGVCESCGKTETINTTTSNNQLLSFDSILQLIINLMNKIFDAILVM